MTILDLIIVVEMDLHKQIKCKLNNERIIDLKSKSKFLNFLLLYWGLGFLGQNCPLIRLCLFSVAKAL